MSNINVNLTTIKANVSEFSDIPTNIFQRQSNGNWMYMFGFEEVEKEFPKFSDDTEPQTYTAYLGFVIKLTGEVTLDNFKKQVMDYFWGVDRENQYINEYNIAVNNLAPSGKSDDYINTYKTFLQERVTVLDKLEKDYINNF